MFGTFLKLSRKKHNPALWITLVYLVVTGAWILFSDKLVLRLSSLEANDQYVHHQRIWLFSLVTAAILYKLIKSSFTEILTSRQKLESSENILKLTVAKQKINELALISYNRRLIELEEELRKALAAELHDELGSDLTALNFTLAHTKECPIGSSGCQFHSQLLDAELLIGGMSRKLRAIIAELRPPVLEDYGLEAALRWDMEQIAKLTNCALTLLTEGAIPRLPADMELALFRITHEALTNTLKHSSALQVTVTLGCTDNTILLSVCDDGVGFFPRAELPSVSVGWGLTLMRERAEMLGGKFLLKPGPGAGTCIYLEIPRECAWNR